MKHVLPIICALLIAGLAHAGEYPGICMEAETLSRSGEDHAVQALDLYNQCLAHELTVEQKGQVHYNVGVLQQGLRRDAEAVASYARAAEANPGDYMAYNNIAWILASSPDPDVVDGEKAEAYARKACALDTNVGTLDTHAAALARVGKYREAAKIQQQVITVAEEIGNLPTEILRELKERLALYRNDKPYTETVKSTALE